MDIKDQKIFWVSKFYEHTGYSYISRTFFNKLFEKGYNIKPEIMNSIPEVDKDIIKYYESLKYKGNNHLPYLGNDAIKIVCWLPINNIPQFKHNIIYTMMESRMLNENFIFDCNRNYNSCWVPNYSMKKIFTESGLGIPVNIVPIGIDQKYNVENLDNIKDYKLIYKVFNKGKKVPQNPNGYKFISVFRWSFRKGFDVLIKSFLREFKKSDNVSLSIISRHAAASFDKRFYDAIEHDINKLFNKYGDENSAPIYWCSDNVPDYYMPKLYANHDVFISTSRGDGIALPPLEASKMGLPVIIPNHTGFEDYSLESTCYNFDVDEWVVCNDIPEWKGWVTRAFDGQEFPRFGNKKVEEISGIMRNVYNNPSAGKEKVINMNKKIDELYTWDAACKSAERELKKIL